MRTLLFLALSLAAFATAQSTVTNATTTHDGGLLQVSQHVVSFDLSSDAWLQAARSGTYAPATSGAFDLAAGVPFAGVWVVQVYVDPPLRIPDSTATLPSRNVWYRVVPTTPRQLPGCVESPWQRIGPGSTVVSLHAVTGAGSCRLQVFLRLDGQGVTTPGTYDGGLRWTLRRATP